MSEDQLKAFMEAVKADAGLQEKLNAAADADAVALIAKEMGFVISADLLQGFPGLGREISEEELEGVAGAGTGSGGGGAGMKPMSLIKRRCN
jgi:predicted ribosomally synthesized peptide with nif11-like leader